MNQGSCVNHLSRFPAPRPGGDVIDVYRGLDFGRDGAGRRFRSWKRGIPGGLGPIQATLFEKGGFQGHGAAPATKWGIWNMAIPGVMGHGPIGDGAFCPTGERRAGWSVREGREMAATARPACGERRGCLIKGDSRVTPYEARDFQRCRVCHTRVEPVSETNVGSGTGRKASPPVQWLDGREYPWPDSPERGARDPPLPGRGIFGGRLDVMDVYRNRDLEGAS